MSTARVTSKGQVTIPAEVRRALKIDQGDDLVFQVTSERSAELRVQKRQRLSDFYGALPAARHSPARETPLHSGKPSAWRGLWPAN